ncbi:MAG: Hsp20/alpha crystallin family protein, partial [Bacteroidota bacterium]
SFEKSFTLPETVNVDDIQAAYQDGILSVTLPKKEVKEEIKRMVEIS